MPEYFTLPELRALPDMADVVKYPDAAVELEAAHVVDVIERNAFPFVVRQVTGEVHSGTRANRQNRSITLSKRYAREVTGLTVNGVAFTASELDELLVVRGVVHRYEGGAVSPSPWSYGVRNIVVDYTHGFSETPPDDVKRAALQATRVCLLTNRGRAGVSDRATSITNELGNIKLATAGVDGPFGIPEVDEVVLGYKRRGKSPLVR